MALAEALEAADPECDILFVGAAGGLEASLLPRLGRQFSGLNVRGLPREVSFKALSSLSLMARAYLKAGRLLRRYRPDVVVGMGGYASLPVAYAAVRRGVPLVIHEQNSVPGLVNRRLGKRATAIALTYPESARFFAQGRGIRVIGNPVRAQIKPLAAAGARERLELEAGRLTVLAVGGSRGARRINMAALEMYDMVRERADLQVLIISGQSQFEETKRTVDSLRRSSDKVVYRVVSYMDEMAVAYAAADVVVSRAGSGSIAELTLCGKPGVLVPYPYATDDHQRANAAGVTAAGAAVVLGDDALSGASLWRTLSGLFEESGKLGAMAEAALAWAKPDAARELAEIVVEAGNAECRMANGECEA